MYDRSTLQCLFTVMVFLVSVSNADPYCMCSCSANENATSSCSTAPQEGTSPTSNKSASVSCNDQTELTSLLQSVQSTVSSLKSEMSQLKQAMSELQENIPEAVSTKLNMSWTVSPGEGNSKTSFPGDIVYEGIHKTNPRDCMEIFEAGDSRGDGIYRIYNPADNKFINVRCSMSCDGGGWMELMRRSGGPVNFNRTWTKYVKGFGKYNTEFWMGLDFMNKITHQYKEAIVRLDFVTFEDDYKYVQYTDFSVGDSTTNYALSLGSYSGSLGSTLSYGNGKQFSTFDADNDKYSGRNCAAVHGGGWWFYPSIYCGMVWPTGVNNQTLIDVKGGGIAYGKTGSSYYNYKEVVMKVRPAFGLP